LEEPPEYVADQGGLIGVDRQSAIHTVDVVAEGRCPTDPPSAALLGRDLVSDALRDYLPLELGVMGSFT
jgi:hypothetical protein